MTPDREPFLTVPEVAALEIARAAQARYLRHVRTARRCACAHGDLCDRARELDRAADAAYRQVGGEL